MISERQELVQWPASIVETSTNSEGPRSGTARLAVAILLILILGLAAAYRLIGVNWDDHTHLHPDERFLTMVTSSLTFPGEQAFGRPPDGCSRWGGYFNTACSPLNPYNHDFGLFVYGTFPIFLTRLAGEIVNQVGYDEIHIVGRVLSAFFDLFCVFFIFLIGKRLYGARVALLAALFLALAVLDIQQSHFFTADTFPTVPILVAFWFALDIADGKKWPAFVFAGLAFGLALAGRINMAFFASVLIAAGALRAYRQASVTRDAPYGPDGDGLRRTSQTNGEERVAERSVMTRSLGPMSVSMAWHSKQDHPETLTRPFLERLYKTGTRALLGLAVTAAMALIVFRIFQPYAANGPSFISAHAPRLDLSRGPLTLAFDVALSWAGGVNARFADNMQWVRDSTDGKIDAPPGHQWTDRTPYLFPLQNMVLWGLGLPLGLAAWAGFLLALYQLLRYRRWVHLLAIVWVGVMFAYTGLQFVKTMRYFLQIYPFLCLFAAWFVFELWDRLGGPSIVPPRRTLARAGAGAFALVVIGYTVFYATAFTTIYTRPYTRVAASDWIYDNIPAGSAIANEHWDDPLPVSRKGRSPFPPTPGGTGAYYRNLPSSSDGEMHWYDEDTPEKRNQAVQWLDETDYIVLSSNRLYGSIPRLPMRFPMTTKYYQWLFDGTLGFTRAAEIASRPELLGITINDDKSEEAFTVYDHPRVLIYKKTPQYSHANTVALLNSVDLSEVYRLTPPIATQAKTALLLTPDNWFDDIRGGTWSRIFHPDDVVNAIPAPAWLILIELLGWIAFPIAFIAFRALADRGYIFSKALGILFPAWGTWMLASLHLLPFDRWTVLLVILAAAIISGLIAWSRRFEIGQFLRDQRAVIITEEVLFLAFFGLFLAIRFGNPDLWHPWYGGEKPMDFAYLNAIIKTTWLPPYDPWFAGGYINYYYFGQMITATLVRLVGIVPEVAYNLALPMFYGMTAMGAFSVVYNLVAWKTQDAADSLGQGGTLRAAGPALLFGLLGAIFVALIGNLGEVVLIGQTFMRIGGGTEGQPTMGMLGSIAQGISRVFANHEPFDVPIGSWYWNATRTIPDTINEFPFFTFLYADLHAHLMALPFTLVVLGLAVNIVRRKADNAVLPFWPHLQISPIDVLEVSLAALVVGALRAINTWDFPTYLLVLISAIVIGEYGRRRTVKWQGLIAVAWRVIAIVILSAILFGPFTSNFATSYESIELWKGEQTTVPQYLVVHGIFLFVIATYLILQTLEASALGTPRYLLGMSRHFGRLEHYLSLHNAIAAPPTWASDLILVTVFGATMIEVALILLQHGVFALVLPLLVLSGLLVLNPKLTPERRLVCLLIAAGLAMTMMVEVIVTRGDIGRMNTVFKFYNQVWVLFAVTAAAALGFALGRAGHVRTVAEQERDVPRVRRRYAAVGSLPGVWWIVFGTLVLVGLLYPAFATRAKVNDRFVAGSPSGLNGMDYMKEAAAEENSRLIEMKYDREAILWLRENVEGSPVIVEARGPLYHWTDRVSINTGLPTIIGWDWHQKQQRSVIDGAIIDHRLADVDTLYNTASVPDATRLLTRYRVSYVYVGDFERAYYSPVGLEKFDSMAGAGVLDLVYDKDHVKIYRVKISS